MDTKKRLQEIAKEYNLELIATTTANNGYPQELKRALIGFTSYEQAEMVAEKGIDIARQSESNLQIMVVDELIRQSSYQEFKNELLPHLMG